MHRLEVMDRKMKLAITREREDAESAKNRAKAKIADLTTEAEAAALALQDLRKANDTVLIEMHSQHRDCLKKKSSLVNDKKKQMSTMKTEFDNKMKDMTENINAVASAAKVSKHTASKKI